MFIYQNCKATLIQLYMFCFLFQQVSGQKSEKHRLVVDHVTSESPADIADIRKVILSFSHSGTWGPCPILFRHISFSSN